MHASAATIAVLAGGRARRLGGAKATAPLAGQPLICHVLAAARSSGLPVLVVAKRDTELPAIAEPVLVEPDEPRHPLCGVLIALEHLAARAQDAALVVAGCDMPFLTGPLLRRLAGFDGAAIAHAGGHAQPLPARVTGAHRSQLARSLARELSLRAALGELRPRVLSERELSRFGDPARLCASVNDAADLERAERWLAERERAEASPA
jgi:molybdenum cofactor guanylyltransferase